MPCPGKIAPCRGATWRGRPPRRPRPGSTTSSVAGARSRARRSGRRSMVPRARSRSATSSAGSARSTRTSCSLRVRPGASPWFVRQRIEGRAGRCPPLSSTTYWAADTTYSVALIWPRISPPLFLAVWAFTYVAPCSIASRAEDVTVTVFETGDLHGPQSETMTGPEVPALPLWMCAANALPLRCENVSLNVSFLPLSVPVNVPVAPVGTPLGFGTSRAAVSFAESLWTPSFWTAARPPAASAAVSARTASVTSAFFNLSSCIDGLRGLFGGMPGAVFAPQPMLNIRRARGCRTRRCGVDLHRKKEAVMPNRSRALSLLVVLVALAALASTGGAATRKSALVKVSKTPLGRILVDSRGRRLYLFEKAKSRKSVCAGSCAVFWPPLLTTAKPRAGAGVTASLLGTTRRAGGTLQVTYGGHPPYTFKLLGAR